MALSSTKAKNKYNESHYERISLFVKTGMKDIIKQEADRQSVSVNEYINTLIKKDISERVGQQSESLASKMYSSDFELFKSNMCHLLRTYGDIEFIRKCLVEDIISEYAENHAYKEMFYSLAIVDYISKLNDVPLYEKYNSLRSQKLQYLVWPKSLIIYENLTGKTNLRDEMYANAIPEFLKYNIIEGDIRNVI